MKKSVTAIVAAGAATVALAVPGGAAANNCSVYDHVSGATAFENSGKGSVQNVNNTENRFGAGGRHAIPGEAGDHANANSAVAPYSTGGSGGIVSPRASDSC